MEAGVRRFVKGLGPLVINEAATAALNSNMNYGKIVAFAQAIETHKLKNRMEKEGSNKARSAGNFTGSSGGGGLVSKERIKVDPQKIAAVKNWHRYTTLTDIRSFLGLARYYKKFVEAFSTLASPLTKLTQKAIKFQWSDACEKSFQELKSRLTTTPVLTLTESTYGFVTMAFSLDTDDGTPRYQERLCVPNVDGLLERIMTEAHNSRYSMHPGSTKMYPNLKEIHWWNDMKRNVADFVARCPNCKQVNDEHRRPGGLAYNIELPMWKWEMINMDFLVGLPRTPLKVDSI
ncbi:uncharacterized protein [Nicotiana tomentosiformis]|uniref:uncharacterized protein n=1 Tax=Nicotiana tomentosiformis TaxID=4098 RepID=UPI00388CAD4E